MFIHVAQFEGKYRTLGRKKKCLKTGMGEQFGSPIRKFKFFSALFIVNTNDFPFMISKLNH